MMDGKSNKTDEELVRIGREHAEVFAGDDGEYYARVQTGADLNGTEVLDWRAFKYWLVRQHPGTVTRTALDTALLNLEAMAEGNPKLPVFHRVAWNADHTRMYLDLGDDTWRVVVVSKEGWSIRSNRDAPVIFRRHKGMLPLPAPVHGGNLELLRPLLNLPAGEVNGASAGWVLCACWLLSALHPSQHWVLCLSGEEGSGKSKMAELLRTVIDPVRVLLRKKADIKPGDTAVMTRHNYVLCIDNISDGLSQSFSDEICMFALGRGGVATRTLYSNSEETMYGGHVPFILNGINRAVSSSDLSNRSLFLSMPRISDEMRRTDSQIDEELRRVWPEVLGGLLDAVVDALRYRASTKLAHVGRMADVETWVCAAERGTALGWPVGTVQDVLTVQRREAAAADVEADMVASTLVELMSGNDAKWQQEAEAGVTMKRVLERLNSSVGENATRDKQWPTSPQRLQTRLARLERVLREQGVTVERLPRSAGMQKYTVVRVSV